MLRGPARPRPSGLRIWLKSRAMDSSVHCRTRYSLRFDPPISRDAGERYARDPGRVATHAFYPFLWYTKKSPRYVKAEHKVTPKKRPIRYASYLDTAIYRHYARCLSDAYEALLAREGLQQCVVAYRALNRSNVELAVEVFNLIRAYVKDNGPCFALCIDIEEFFESLDHRVLKARWQDLLSVDKLPKDHYNVFKSVTRYAYIDRQKLLSLLNVTDPTQCKRICTAREFREIVRRSSGRDGRLIKMNTDGKGIPQGCPLSAVLSNVYMVSFDRAVSTFCNENRCHYRRYSDDIIVLGPVDLEERTREYLSEGLRAEGLSVNTRKTEVRHFCKVSGECKALEGPLQYLGLTFDGQTVLLRSATLSRYHRRLRKYIGRCERSAMSSRRSARLFRRKAFRRFTMRGRGNFITGYALRAHDTVVKAGLKSGIQGQIRRHWTIVNTLLMDADKRVAAARGGGEAVPPRRQCDALHGDE